MRTRILIGSVATCFLVTACGGQDSPPAVTVTQTVTQSAISAEPSGSSSSTTSEKDDELTNTAEPTTAQATAKGTAERATTEAIDLTKGDISVDEVDFGKSSTNSRGELVKKMGQWAGVTSYDQETVVALFRVTEITLDPDCNSTIVQPPQNGHYLALTFEVQTAPELAEEAAQGLPGTIWISPMEMKVFDSEGNRENDSVGMAMTCFESSDTLPAETGPGEKVKGTVVLDTAVESGTVVMSLLGAAPGSPGGWAWNF